MLGLVRRLGGYGAPTRFSYLAALSIGVFVLPVAALALLVVATRTPRCRRRSG